MQGVYIDTSALVKLFVPEAESVPLRRWLTDHKPRLVTSEITTTELLRACRRYSPETASAVRASLNTLTIVALTRDLSLYAALVEPAALRTLDAIHIATATKLSPDLRGIITYDKRMVDAAMSQGLQPISPGAHD